MAVRSTVVVVSMVPNKPKSTLFLFFVRFKLKKFVFTFFFFNLQCFLFSSHVPSWALSIALETSFSSLNPVMTYVPGVLSALQRCLLEAPSPVSDTLDHSLTVEVLVLLENMSLLLLGVLYGDREACATEKGNGVICRNSNYEIHYISDFTKQ